MDGTSRQARGDVPVSLYDETGEWCRHSTYTVGLRGLGVGMDAQHLAPLSAQLIDAIASVDLQRSVLEELIVSLASEAQQLNGVAAVLAEAAATQAGVVAALQRDTPMQLPSLSKSLMPALAARDKKNGAEHSENSAGQASSSASPMSSCATESPLAYVSPTIAPSPSMPPTAAPREALPPARMGIAPRASMVVEPDFDSDEGGVDYVQNLRTKGAPAT